MSAFFGRAIGPLLLISAALGLTACQATYDDTKGWANRLEASLLEAAHESFDGSKSRSARENSRRGHTSLQWQEAERDPNTQSRPGSASGLVQQTAAEIVAPTSEPPDLSGGIAPAKGKPGSDETTTKEIDPTGPSTVAPPVAAQALPKLKPSPPPLRKADKGTKAAKTDKPEGAAMVIHLSSLRSEAAAKKEWRALKKAFPDQLSAMSPSFRRTEVANRGVFYRVLAGPLPSQQSARQLCGVLKAKKQYCQVMPAPPTT